MMKQIAESDDRFRTVQKFTVAAVAEVEGGRRLQCVLQDGGSWLDVLRRSHDANDFTSSLAVDRNHMRSRPGQLLETANQTLAASGRRGRRVQCTDASELALSNRPHNTLQAAVCWQVCAESAGESDDSSRNGANIYGKFAHISRYSRRAWHKFLSGYNFHWDTVGPNPKFQLEADHPTMGTLLQCAELRFAL